MADRGISLSCDHCKDRKIRGKDGQFHCPNQCRPTVIEVVSVSDTPTEIPFDELERALHQGIHNPAWDEQK